MGGRGRRHLTNEAQCQQLVWCVSWARAAGGSSSSVWARCHNWPVSASFILIPSLLIRNNPHLTIKPLKIIRLNTRRRIHANRSEFYICMFNETVQFCDIIKVTSINVCTSCCTLKTPTNDEFHLKYSFFGAGPSTSGLCWVRYIRPDNEQHLQVQVQHELRRHQEDSAQEANTRRGLLSTRSRGKLRTVQIFTSFHVSANYLEIILSDPVTHGENRLEYHS